MAHVVVRFLAYGVTGVVCEYLVGQAAYRIRGKYLYVYPDSMLKTSSPWMIPAWGTIGLIFEVIGKVLKS